MDPRDSLPDVRPVRSGPPGSGPWLIVGVMATLIGVAILKPWPQGDGMSAATHPPPPPSASGPTDPQIRGPGTEESAGLDAVSSSATGLAIGTDPAESECYYAGGWRVFVLVEQPDRVRAWISVAPIVATGPSDASVPIARVFLEPIAALGYCAPRSGKERPPTGAVVSAWEIVANRSHQLVLATAPQAEPSARSTQGLFAPPRSNSRPEAAWKPGRYVFQVAGGSGQGYQRWFGVEIMASAARPTASPAATGQTAAPRPTIAASPRPRRSRSLR